jgi:endonuclease/exonuclease/phosphatase family metal-dependent hydrolase
MDRRVDLARISEVIAAFEPHVVALQEVDVGRTRSGVVDQPAELAVRLGMSAHLGMCIEHGAERYGIATLTRLPSVAAQQIALPHEPHRRRSEPRCALVTRLLWPEVGVELDLVNTHLSILRRERPAQVAAILRELPGPEIIIAGDFNCTPISSAFRTLACDMRSATGGARTYPSWLPIAPIDHILIRGTLGVVRGGRWTRGPVRRASDHLPVFAELAYTADA